MRQVRLCMCASLLVGISLVVGPRAEAALPEEAPGCNTSIDHSFRLSADVGPCTGNWILLTEPDLVIDLGGHTVSGNDNDDLVATGESAVESNSARTTVRNGIVRDFDSGLRLLGDRARVVDVVSLSNTTGNGLGMLLGNEAVVTNSVANQNENDGINASADSVVTGSQASFNGADGITLSSGDAIANIAHDNDGSGITAEGVVRGNVVSLSGSSGISAGSQSVVKNNELNDNTGGIALSGSRHIVSGNIVTGSTNYAIAAEDGDTITGNRLNDNGGGIAWDGTSGTITANRIRSNADDGIFVFGGTAVLIANNRLIGNGGDGIEIMGTASPRVRDNVANGNGQHGILDGGTGARIRDNVVKQNGFANDDGVGLGIDANADATVRGGGNIARLNEDSDQCEPGFLC